MELSWTYSIQLLPSTIVIANLKISATIIPFLIGWNAIKLTFSLKIVQDIWIQWLSLCFQDSFQEPSVFETRCHFTEPNWIRTTYIANFPNMSVIIWGFSWLCKVIGLGRAPWSYISINASSMVWIFLENVFHLIARNMIIIYNACPIGFQIFQARDKPKNE